MNNIIRFVFLSIISLLFIRCSTDSPVAGGGLDTESSGGRLLGSVKFGNGIPGTKTIIKLLPYNYSPFVTDSIKSVTTDNMGCYQFNDLDTGIYNIEALSIDSGSRLLHFNIRILKDSLITIDPDTLKLPGIISINFKDSIGPGCFYIPGTTISIKLSGKVKTLHVDSIPAASSLPLFFREESSSDDMLLTDNIQVVSGNTTVINQDSSRTHSQLITINTSGSGTSISSELLSIPVLIKLSTENFDFSQIHIEDDNLRFTKTNGMILNHEIEQWDTINKTACIWVLLDTLNQDDTNKQIIINWGNKDPVISPYPYSVFDTADGFRGVWHIVGEKSGIRNHDLYKDATIYNNHGDDFIHARGITGVIGNGKEFNGEDDYIAIADTSVYHFGSGPFTISLWFNKIDSGKGALITYKFADDKEFGIISDSSNNIFAYSLQAGNLDTICKSPSLICGQWHHINLVRNGQNIFELYIDGELTHQNSFNIDINNAGKGEGLFIGSNINIESEPFDPFKGYIDEFRLESVARSPEWIKFNYLNQK